MKPICDYCDKPATLVDGSTVYPHRPDLAFLNFWYCADEHEPVYVGCHKGTETPLGTLADAELRQLRSQVHAAFDPMWKSSNNRRKSRTELYKRLAELMALDEKSCHIGMFNVDECFIALGICETGQLLEI